MRSAWPLKFCVLLAVCLAALAGCALLEGTESLLSRTAAKPNSDKNVLPPIPTSRDAMKIDVVFVERPVGDRLLGKVLWQEVDQVGAVPAETRQLLSEVGLRVGNAGTSPPQALEKLLELTTEQSDSANADDAKKLKVRQMLIPSGGEALIHANYMAHCVVKVPGREGLVEKEFDDATGVFRLRATRMQDGWAQLEFQPEIHFGPSTMKRIAAKGGWMSTFAQDVEPILDRRFSVNLHVGEMAVITVEGDAPDSLGGRFFLRGDSQAVQRVLVVRLTNMTKTDAVFAK